MVAYGLTRVHRTYLISAWYGGATNVVWTWYGQGTKLGRARYTGARAVEIPGRRGHIRINPDCSPRKKIRPKPELKPEPAACSPGTCTYVLRAASACGSLYMAV